MVSTIGAAHEHVIDGVTGLVAADVTSFAASILELFGAPDRRLAMSRAARVHARGYDMDHAVASTWRIYRDVIRAREAASYGVAS